MRALGDELRRAYADDDTVRVFTKGDKSNEADFGLTELLYDVCVCRVATVQSATNRTRLWYVKEPLWQVESEFARDSFEALKDFNKLCWGPPRRRSSSGPAFTTPMPSSRCPAAMSCSPTDAVHCALVPHPDAWDEGVGAIDLYTLRHGAWVRQDLGGTTRAR